MRIDDVYSRWNPQPYNDECGVKQTTGPIGIQIGADFDLSDIDDSGRARRPVAANAKRLRDVQRQRTSPGSPAWCYGGSSFGFVALTDGAMRGSRSR